MLSPAPNINRARLNLVAKSLAGRISTNHNAFTFKQRRRFQTFARRASTGRFLLMCARSRTRNYALSPKPITNRLADEKMNGLARWIVSR
ncbi:MAG: hypothetical protein C4334_11785 [Pyrinomonas sp.]